MDLVVTDDQVRAELPQRHRHFLDRGGNLVPGFTDLVYATAFFSQPLLRYRYLWLVEYDVDYAGDWSAFFQQFAGDHTDLLGASLYSRAQSAKWLHWLWFNAPVPEQAHLRSFLPVARLSRDLLYCYRDAIESGGWEGHSEAIWPTVASASGLAIRDFGALGPFTPDHLRGKNYSQYHNVEDGDLSNGTFICRPVTRRAYFQEEPEEYPDAGYLHHPVKVDWPERT